ncbi:hypothetical protein [Actibacterium lipolyticum]|uniref:Uncharacterized protein n=1 Tax=Actibacterium lipolyticum TaxID=1524263 RepID=A0A238KUZ9_9RHOB|nr:hypothetical protein [Actibacterium lipolyticum]SMX46625.1 hypothetical protein COL8621_03185 [Actibacterium lipolyticum]
MIRLALTLSLCLAGQANALSCMRPDVARSFQFANESDKLFVLAHGKLIAPDPGPRQRPEKNGQHGASRSYDATFEGKGISPRGFDAPFTAPVTITETCLSVWCGKAPLNQDVVVFIEKSETGYLVEEGPCGGMIFAAPSPTDLKRLTNCMRGKKCEPMEPQR